MTLVVLAVVTAVVLAVIFRGRPSTFLRPNVRRLGLLGILLIALITSGIAKSTGVSVGWLVLGGLALIWFAALNRGRPGIGLMFAGLTLNCVVTIANAGMPVSLVAVERAGVPVSRVPLETDPLREELTDATSLPWLGEVVPLALPLRPAVASAGDVLLGAGAALFLFTGLTGLGRAVPKRVLTPKEKRKVRKSRKAAREAEAEATASSAEATSDQAFADAAMYKRDAPADGEPVVPRRGVTPAAATDPRAPAVATTGSAAAAEASEAVEGIEAVEGPVGESVDPAAAAAQAALAAAEAERRKLKRQLKQVKKVARTRRKVVAELDADEEPGETAGSDVDSPPSTAPSVDAASEAPVPEEPMSSPTTVPEREPETPTTTDLEPLTPDEAPAAPPAHASIGAARGRQVERTSRRAKPAPANGVPDDPVPTRRDRPRGRRATDGNDGAAATDAPTPASTPVTTAPSTDQPPG